MTNETTFHYSLECMLILSRPTDRHTQTQLELSVKNILQQKAKPNKLLLLVCVPRT